MAITANLTEYSVIAPTSNDVGGSAIPVHGWAELDQLRLLKQYLRAHYRLTPAEYREKWVSTPTVGSSRPSGIGHSD